MRAHELAPLTVSGIDLFPRPYQEEALVTLHAHICNYDTNPCVVIPTGGGKSLLMAWAIQRWKQEYPPFRVCILAHRKELVSQNALELRAVWPNGDIGVFSAGLKRREDENSIICASIDSVYNKWGTFPPFDCLIIDEAHRIPASGEGKYRQFIEGCRSFNQSLRVIGFTATPYRMSCGPLCHKTHILQKICYEANVGDLIARGYLCKLRSKIGDVQPNLADVQRNSGGDYIVKSLARAVDKKNVVSAAVQSAMRLIVAERRKSIIFFCVDISHCKAVSQDLTRYGISAPVVTAKTPSKERDTIASGFKAGRIRAICNVNVFTEGFNAKQVDCVVLLRPTLSKGLYMQMVGRGLRPHPDKDYCLVLDYAHCIDEHGPIDCLEAGRPRIVECPECGDAFSRAIRVCPNCGWAIPKQEIDREEAKERERKMHEAERSNQNILGSELETIKVSSVTIHRHVKVGQPDSLRVQYRCGLRIFREWICLDHEGWPGKKARQWWMARGLFNAETVTVNEAAQNNFLSVYLEKKTEAIVVKKKGKHFEIIGYKFRTKEEVEHGMG